MTKRDAIRAVVTVLGVLVFGVLMWTISRSIRFAVFMAVLFLLSNAVFWALEIWQRRRQLARARQAGSKEFARQHGPGISGR